MNSRDERGVAELALTGGNAVQPSSEAAEAEIPPMFTSGTVAGRPVRTLDRLFLCDRDSGRPVPFTQLAELGRLERLVAFGTVVVVASSQASPPPRPLRAASAASRLAGLPPPPLGYGGSAATTRSAAHVAAQVALASARFPLEVALPGGTAGAGTLRVAALGAAVCGGDEGAATFHTRSVIYPLGYRAVRAFESVLDLRRRAEYCCEVVRGRGGSAGFRVALQGASPAVAFEGGTPTTAWQAVVRATNEQRRASVATSSSAGTAAAGGSQAAARDVEAVDGDALFGLIHSGVAGLIEVASEDALERSGEESTDGDLILSILVSVVSRVHFTVLPYYIKMNTLRAREAAVSIPRRARDRPLGS